MVSICHYVFNMKRMKTKSIVYITRVLAAALLLTSCDPDVEIPGQENIDSYTAVYIPQAGRPMKPQILGIDDEPQIIYLGVAYGGAGYPSRNIDVTFTVDQALIDSYNATNKTEYSMLPQEAYTLSGKEVVIPSGKTGSSLLKLIVDPKKWSHLSVT